MGPVIFITGERVLRGDGCFLLLASMGPVIFITGEDDVLCRATEG